MSFIQAANGKHYQDVMERQMPMIDSKSGGKMDYLKECGALAGL